MYIEVTTEWIIKMVADHEKKKEVFFNNQNIKKYEL